MTKHRDRNDTNATGYSAAPPNLQQDFIYNSNHKKECNDVFFLLVFLAVVIMTIVFAAKYGGTFLDATRLEDLSANSGYTALFNTIIYCALAAIGISLAWVVIMIIAGEFLIWTALLCIIVGFAVTAEVITKNLYNQNYEHYWWPAVVFGTAALLVALYACCVRHRIKFAAVHLRVAGTVVLSLPMSLLVAFLMVFVQLAWIYTWVLGEFGLLYHGGYIDVPKDCTKLNCNITTNRVGAIIGITAGMVVVFYWAAKVVKNIVHVTIAGTVAAWKIRTNSPFITVKALIRAMTFSLGSICFGSLIVSILETIKQFFNFLRFMAARSGNCCAACVACCLSCCISCIQNLVEFFNRYAFTYVGIYGYSFITAGGHATKLFASKGWSAIVNDNLTGNVFWLSDLAIAALTALIGVHLVDHQEDRYSNVPNPKVVVGLLSFMAGYAISHIFMAVMSSGVCTVFVLWAEDPHGWRVTHPKHYEKLHAAWQKIYPSEYNDGYGKQNPPSGV